MYPQAVSAIDSLQMLGDTLRFVGIAYEGSDTSALGLKYYLVLMFVLGMGAFLFVRCRFQLGVYIKMFLQPQKDISYNFDIPVSRLQSWFCVAALLVSSLFLARLTDATAGVFNWQPLLLGFVLVLAFFLLKRLLNFFFAWIHLPSSQWGVLQTRVTATLSLLSIPLLLLLLLDEGLGFSARLMLQVALVCYVIIKLISLPGLFRFFFTNGLSFFHSLLYFCVLELAPLLIGLKGLVLIMS